MKKQSNTALPHIGICTRLKHSKIHKGGVGVFAIIDIPKGTNIFGGDVVKMVWIDRNKVKHVDPEIKKLYNDFCVIKGDKYGCPVNFNSMTIGWYLNHSKTNPSVGITKSYDFVALRNIKKGEELSTDYATFNEPPEKKLRPGRFYR